MSSEIAKEAQAQAFLDYQPRAPDLSAIALADLNPENKSRLRRELYQRLDQAQFTLDDVLLERHLNLVQEYLPRQGSFSSQEKVTLRIYGDPRATGFKGVLQHALFRIDRRYYLGPRAVEVLKPENFFYTTLLTEGFDTIDQLLALQEKPEEVIQKFKRRFIFAEIQRLLKGRGFDFDPNLDGLKFPEELPPKEAFEHFESLR